MGSKSLINGIYDEGLCLGCGLCESVSGKDVVEMELQADGFFKPVVRQINSHSENIIKEICPGINIANDLTFNKEESIWGRINKLYSGYATDKDIRMKGSSGGIVSAIAVYALEEGFVSAVLQVGGDNNDYERNTLNVSYSRKDVLNCASSRYAPALIFDKIFDLLEGTDDTYCFIGKPCDISALKNFLGKFPQYLDRFKLTISIMCAGMPSFNGTKAIVEEFKPIFPVRNLVYRGNGWPGFFSFTDSGGNRFKKTYNDSWGRTLNRHLNLRCKVCPDGIGLQADIAVGDAWETKDGYPDFTEGDGQSLIILRTDAGALLFGRAFDDGKVLYKKLDIGKLQLMQPYQYSRRKVVGARVIAFNIINKNLLKYTGVRLYRNLQYVPIRTIYSEFLGSFKRVLKRRLKKAESK